MTTIEQTEDSYLTIISDIFKVQEITESKAADDTCDRSVWHQVWISSPLSAFQTTHWGWVAQTSEDDGYFCGH